MRVTAFLALVIIPVLAGCPDPKPDPPVTAGPPLGEEAPPEGEAEALASILKTIEESLRRTYPSTVPMRRDAHPKHHGCVRASFAVNEDLPAALAVGVFQPGQRYDAWVRFSNASRTVQADITPDARGMAIKLLGVPGDKLLDDEEHTQDFALINHPVFFVRHAIDYEEFVKKDALDRPLEYFLSLSNPARWHLDGLSIVRAIFSKRVGNPLEIQYHSMTPFLHGAKPQAVKYRARPCQAHLTPIPSPADDDYLRHALATSLSEGDACFDFDVQLQTDSLRMPIEDATIEWDAAESPFINVARLTIPAQTFDTPGQQRFCEDLSYAVWHALPEHRPLGSLNRIRRPVYELVNQLRHDHNGRPTFEPDSLDLPEAYR